MKFVTLMVRRKEDLDEEPIEPEVMGPIRARDRSRSVRLAKASHSPAPEDHHPAGTTAVVPVTALQQYLAEAVSIPISQKKKNCACSMNIKSRATAMPQ